MDKFLRLNRFKKWLYLYAIFSILIASSALAKISPSFNCSNNVSPTEKIICNDEYLSKMDVQLTEYYDEAKSVTSDKKYFFNEAQNAIKERNRNCTDQICLVDWYKTRTDYYKKVISEVSFWGKLKKQISKYKLSAFLSIAVSAVFALALLTKSYKTLVMLAVYYYYRVEFNNVAWGDLYIWLSACMILLFVYLKQRRTRYLREKIKETIRNIIYSYSKELNKNKRFKISTDIYGIEDWTKWEKDKDHFINHKIRPYLFKYRKHEEIINSIDIDSMIEDETEDYDSFESAYDPKMTGREYELFVAEELKNYDWDVRVTPGSGDYGADIIATKNNIRVVIECKKWTTQSVSGVAVKAAFTAKAMYEAQYAAVVSNAEFTPAAKKLAKANNVALLHHDFLDELDEKLQEISNY